MPPEAQLSMCLDCNEKAAADTKYVKTATAKAMWYNAKRMKDVCMLLEKVL